MPHWDAAHAIYFVTFGLADAIPVSVRARLSDEASALLRQINATRGRPTMAEERTVRTWLVAKLTEALDAGSGCCVMRDARVAHIVADAIRYFDGERYELLAWCVMPNHAHVVLTLREVRLPQVIQSWKSFTSKRINALLERTGSLWRSDYFDRCIRDREELHNTIDYVLDNPRKAGLDDWPFVGSFPERIFAI